MITLKDFQKYDVLVLELRTFLCEKCIEYNEATYEVNGDPDVLYKDLNPESVWWEFNGGFVKVHFREDGSVKYEYHLPIDVVFDFDFKAKMKVRFEEEREKEMLRLLERRRLHEEEARRLAEKKRSEEIERLHELMRKYPEECK
jgi:hypothetical protein